MTEQPDWLEWAIPVEEPEQRAELARWAVSLRRAHAAGTAQVKARLTARNLIDYDDDDNELPGSGAIVGHCCLGIWCQVKMAAGVLEATPDGKSLEYRGAGSADAWIGATLPDPVKLGGANDPDLLAFIDHSAFSDLTLEGAAEGNGYVLASGAADVEQFVRYERKVVTASELNDDCGLNFAQIADAVIWRYALTPEELADAELAPRVPEVEGPAPEPEQPETPED